MIFQYFSRQIYFSRTFQESPLNSSTFQACVNPVNDKFNFNSSLNLLGLLVHFTLEKSLKTRLLLAGPPTSKCSKILNTFLFLFSTKMLVIRDRIPEMLVRRANREDPDQTASSEAV